MRNLDLISTEIKINFDGFKSHASIFGFLLTIAVLGVTIAFGIYEARELWEKKKPISNVLNGYTPDSGIYHLGIGGLNHFYNIMSREGKFVDYDERYVVVESQLVNRENVILGTYRYKKCIWELDGVDFHKFEKNVNKEKFEAGACLREFVNSTTKEVMVLSESNKHYFPYPNITHGMESTVPLSEKNVYFSTLRECNPLTEQCFSADKIKEYYVDHFYVFAFIDKNFDITNHKEPIKSTYNQVEGLMSTNSFTANHLNLNPSSVVSDDGIIFEEIKRQRSIYLYQNEKIAEQRVNNPTLTQVNFWLKNQETVYSRSYAKIQDIFANIGGFFNFIYYSALIINFLPEKYRVILDTIILLDLNKFIFSSEKRSKNQFETEKININLYDQENRVNSENRDQIQNHHNILNINNIQSNNRENRSSQDLNNNINNNSNINNNEISNNNLRERTTIYPNLSKKNLKLSPLNLKENINNEDTTNTTLYSSINFFDVLLNIFKKSHMPMIDRIDHLRQTIMSENVIFRSVLNASKKRKTLFGKDELKILNNTPIYNEEFDELL